MTSSFDFSLQSAASHRESGTSVLRGKAVETAHVTSFTVDPAHNRRRTDRLPPVSEQLSSARREGWESGYRAGLDAGRATAESSQAEAIQQAAQVLGRIAATADAQQLKALSVTARDVTELAFELTRTLLGHELSASATPGMSAVSRALKLASPGQELTVRLHPQEVIAADLLQPLVPDCRLAILADTRIERGGCIVESGPCRIDAQIQPALERVRSVLFGALSKESEPVASTDEDAIVEGSGPVESERGGLGHEDGQSTLGLTYTVQLHR